MTFNILRRRATVLFFTVALVFTTGSLRGQPAKSVVLFISDGTGVSHLTALRYAGEDFQFPRFPVMGLFTTHALDRLVTDSAAGATAFATGEKTNNGMISMRPDGTALRTVLELAEEQGRATGLVATSQITHATPACFGAHVKARKMEMEIARQLSAQEIEVLFGGGQKFFLTNDEAGNLVEQMQQDGYRYVDTREALTSLGSENTERAIGLFAESGMQPAIAGRLPLALMTRKAVEILERDPDGFFLMVEASQVDWEGHDNDTDGIVAEMQDMNQAVRWLLNYQVQHPDVLVVWVSDHETGGFAVEGGDVAGDEITGDFTSTHHTAQMVPAFAIGPGADHFAGIYDNTDVGKRLFEVFRLKD